VDDGDRLGRVDLRLRSVAAVLAAVDLLKVNPSRATQSLRYRTPMPVPSKNESSN
jgi:hypothetical protein